MKSIMFLLTTCFLCSCMPDIQLVLENKTDKQIRYREEIENYNDSIPNLTSCEQGTLYNILPKSEHLMTRGLYWERYFKEFPMNSLHIYLINEDTLMKYGKCEVLKKQLFIRKYNITYEQAKRMNWRIVFDGK